MGAPQIIYIALSAAGIAIVLVKHGKPRDEKYNFWTSLITNAMIYALLIWGGFFS